MEIPFFLSYMRAVRYRLLLPPHYTTCIWDKTSPQFISTRAPHQRQRANCQSFNRSKPHTRRYLVGNIHPPHPHPFPKSHAAKHRHVRIKNLRKCHMLSDLFRLSVSSPPPFFLLLSKARNGTAACCRHVETAIVRNFRRRL